MITEIKDKHGSIYKIKTIEKLLESLKDNQAVFFVEGRVSLDNAFLRQDGTGWYQVNDQSRQDLLDAGGNILKAIDLRTEINRKISEEALRMHNAKCLFYRGLLEKIGRAHV